MDSPLNQAHRCHRKADHYLSEHRFKEAIDCHLKAAVYLSEALTQTSCHIMKASLEAQKEFHLSQEKVLSQRESCETQLKINYKKELINKQIMAERFAVYNCNDNKSDNNSSEMEKTGGNCLKVELMNVMEEHDSLLQFLICNKTENINHNQTESTNVSNSSDSIYKSGSRKPKDDKTTIEELQTVNEKLRQLVERLFEELEKSQTDNVILQNENQRLKAHRNASTSILPELPPLEQPALYY